MISTGSNGQVFRTLGSNDWQDFCRSSTHVPRYKLKHILKVYFKPSHHSVDAQNPIYLPYSNFSISKSSNWFARVLSLNTSNQLFHSKISRKKKQVVPRLKESASSFKVNPVSLTDSQNNTTVMCCWKCFKLFSVLTSKIFMSFLSLMLFPHFPHSVFSSPVSSFNIFIYIHTYS